MPSLLRGLSLAGLLGLAWLALACGPSAEEVDRRIEQRVREILAQYPTPTPLALPTSRPAPTPAPTATPQPTATPLSLPPTPTPIVLPPTPTPITLPPPPLASSQSSNDLSQVHRDAWQSVFLIETPSRTGTGWLIEPGLVLTNEHVIGRYLRVTIRQAVDPAFSAAVVARDSRRDIALLQFDPQDVRLPPDVRPLPLGDISNSNIAQPLIALGYSSVRINGNGTVGLAGANLGVLSQITDFGDRSYGSNLVMDVPVDPGDSGGPVLNDRGQVVGMVRAVQEETNTGQRVVGTFYSVHVEEIRAALPALKRGESR